MSTLKGLSFHVPRLPRPMSRGGADPYTTIWTFRGIMLLRMRQAGVKSLPIGSIGMDLFTAMNPDEKGHVEKLVKSLRNRGEKCTVPQLVALCGHPRPELLSMVCCFAGDQSLDSVDIDSANVAAWTAKRKQLERQHGMTPHLAQVCKKMRRA